MTGVKQKTEQRAWVTVQQYAEHFQLSEQNVRNMCEKGEIAGALKIGRLWRIPGSHLVQITI